MNDLLTTGTWRRSSDIAVVEHEDRIVALDLCRPADPPVVLDGTAGVIWHLLEGVETEARLVAVVARTFGRPEAEVATHVGAFLLQLEALGLVTSAGESS